MPSPPYPTPPATSALVYIASTFLPPTLRVVPEHSFPPPRLPPAFSAPHSPDRAFSAPFPLSLPARRPLHPHTQSPTHSFQFQASVSWGWGAGEGVRGAGRARAGKEVGVGKKSGRWAETGVRMKMRVGMNMIRRSSVGHGGIQTKKDFVAHIHFGSSSIYPILNSM